MNSDRRYFEGEHSHATHDVKTIVSEIWREVLQINEIPTASDNFFALGGDSMAMVTLEFRIQEELAVTVVPGTLLTASTFGELTAAVDQLLRQTTDDCGLASPQHSS